MTHAYSESYLNNAKDRLSSFFDYAINNCKLKPDWITALFINTGYAEQFERGNPAYVAGMSGVELARAVITKAAVSGLFGVLFDKVHFSHYRNLL